LVELIEGDAGAAPSGRTEHHAATTSKNTTTGHKTPLASVGNALQDNGIKPDTIHAELNSRSLHLRCSCTGRRPSPASTSAIAGEEKERGQAGPDLRKRERVLGEMNAVGAETPTSPNGVSVSET
jgi:hypothetical protein